MVCARSFDGVNTDISMLSVCHIRAGRSCELSPQKSTYMIYMAVEYDVVCEILLVM